MHKIVLRGLAWGHRRATAPLKPLLEAFQRTHPHVTIEWTVRPLSAFEHQTIGEIAAQFDLLIIDHPFCGEIAERQAFLDLARPHPELFGPEADRLYIGPSLASYRYGGGVWAAPIDGATMHALYRADLMREADEEVPTTWADAVALGARLRRKDLYLGIAAHTPHAAAAMFSLMANVGKSIPTDPHAPFALERAALEEALDLVKQVVAHCPRDALDWSSIALHDAMEARDDIVYCPCVYGYGTYGEPDYRRRLSFAGFAGVRGPAGSMLGGTGLAVSRFSPHPEEALAFTAFAASASAQHALIARWHGQPGAVDAWSDPVIDRHFNGYFSGARLSMETAWIRPRRPGYIPFQHEAGAAIESHLKGEIGERAAVDAVIAAAEKVPQ